MLCIDHHGMQADSFGHGGGNSQSMIQQGSSDSRPLRTRGNGQAADTGNRYGIARQTQTRRPIAEIDGAGADGMEAQNLCAVVGNRHIGSAEVAFSLLACVAPQELVECRLAAIEVVAPMVQPDDPRVHANGEELYLDNVNGTTPDYERIDSVSLSEGRFFNETENLNRRPVAVIGIDIATTFWPTMTPIGKKFMIDNYEVEVIGVMEKQGTFFTGFNLDNQIVVPITRFTRDFARWPDFTIQVKAPRAPA